MFSPGSQKDNNVNKQGQTDGLYDDQTTQKIIPLETLLNQFDQFQGSKDFQDFLASNTLLANTCKDGCRVIETIKEEMKSKDASYHGMLAEIVDETVAHIKHLHSLSKSNAKYDINSRPSVDTYKKLLSLWNKEDILNGDIYQTNIINAHARKKLKLISALSVFIGGIFLVGAIFTGILTFTVSPTFAGFAIGSLIGAIILFAAGANTYNKSKQFEEKAPVQLFSDKLKASCLFFYPKVAPEVEINVKPINRSSLK